MIDYAVSGVLLAIWLFCMLAGVRIIIKDLKNSRNHK